MPPSDRRPILIPQRLLGVREAITAASDSVAEAGVETAWTDAGPIPADADWAGGTVFVDERAVDVDATPERTYLAVCRVGGGRGYYAANWLWRLRGTLDRLAGGPGLRRGRRHPESVTFGDALDFWRVTAAEPGRRLDLRAEMKLPGEALLSFSIVPVAADRCRLTPDRPFQAQRAVGPRLLVRRPAAPRNRVLGHAGRHPALR